jgi:catechol 2,3-dioxygenase-like lactoylglutathione lyase family enzyme
MPDVRTRYVAQNRRIERPAMPHASVRTAPRSAWRLVVALHVGHDALVSSNVDRLVTVVLTVSNLDRAVALYGDGFGLDLHIDDHRGDDPWTSGRHAATSWTDGAFLHFALYETKDGATTSGAQIAFRVGDIESAHQRALRAGVEVLHAPKAQPWGVSARYRDADGNIIELTQGA